MKNPTHWASVFAGIGHVQYPRERHEAVITNLGDHFYNNGVSVRGYRAQAMCLSTHALAVRGFGRTEAEAAEAAVAALGDYACHAEHWLGRPPVTFEVGPNRQLRNLNDALMKAKRGDVIVVVPSHREYIG